jgi:catechol 2,3-dioxygenase-like lactoylglutathione lyase family enzyme
MFKDSHAFSSFSTDDVEKAKQFYGETLGLDAAIDDKMGILQVKLAGGGRVMLYPKDDHAPATFTVLNFPAKDIDEAVDALAEKGVAFERYDTDYIKTDEKGIARGDAKGQGPRIAWFKDPAGNVLAVLTEV